MPATRAALWYGGPIIAVTIDILSSCRCRREWDDRRRDADNIDVTPGITTVDRRHGQHHAAGRPTRAGRAGTEQRPPSATPQRAADDAGLGRWRRRWYGRIPGDVQVGWSVRSHQSETLFDVHHQHEGVFSDLRIQYVHRSCARCQIIFSERELKFMFAICHRLSVCRLSSVCNVRAPYSDDWNFRQCFYAIGYLGHLLTSR